MRVVLEFQDEDSENSPLRKTAARFFGRAARTPIPKQKRIFIPVLCTPDPPTRPADPTFGGRSGICRRLRAEPSGGRSGPRRAPGRTPTSDP